MDTIAKRILIVDDEPNIRTVAKACLETLADWEVILASSGEEGLLQAAHEQPDAILLDVVLPGMSGIAFLEKLLKNPVTSNIPVIFFTTKSEFIKTSAYKPLGAKGGIIKPFQPLSLISEITSILDWY